MKPVFARQPFPDEVDSSIFLAGPTPRKPEVESWRPQALEFLRKMGYEGHVFVPESPDFRFTDWANPIGEPPEIELPLHEAALRWKRQVQWEEEGLNRADLILFWIPRDMATMPALTTNNEFGNWIVRDPAKVVLAVPPGAPHTSYQLHQAIEEGLQTFDDLADALAHCSLLLKAEPRRGGECCVPRHIWRHPAFKQWYEAQRFAGNDLRGGRVSWTFRVGPGKKHLFCFAYHAKVWVKEEDRVKENEFVLGRPDISTVVAYATPPGGSLENTYVVLGREFRTPAANMECFVYEPPSGSSFKPGFTPQQLAAAEFAEETGIKISPDRFKEVEARQVASTLSSHSSHLFAVELTVEELDQAIARERSKAVEGVEEDTERVQVRVRSVREIRGDMGLVDWSAYGQILAALHAMGVRQI